MSDDVLALALLITVIITGVVSIALQVATGRSLDRQLKYWESKRYEPPNSKETTNGSDDIS